MSTLPTHRGYTLLELIVSVGIFSLIMLAVSSAYLTLIKLDRETRAVNDIINNLSFAVDSLGREMRTGHSYDCNPATPATLDNCTSGGGSFAFTDSNGRSVEYELSNGQIVATIDSGAPFALTDPRIVISDLTFYVRGAQSGDGIQPQTILVIQGDVYINPTRSVGTSVEVTATQRLLDL